MKPVSFSPYEQILKAHDSNLGDVPVLTSRYSNFSPEILSGWKLSFWERIKLLFLGKIFVHVLSEEMPPIKLSQDVKHIEDINLFYAMRQ